MTISFARHQFPPAIIRHAGWLYMRFTLSYRDVEDLLAERGLDISYETVRRWVLKFGPLFARELRRRRPRPTSRWHLDEMAVVIAGRQFWLWRAVDDEGEVLDLLVQQRRDKATAVKLMRKLLKKQGFAPDVLVTDKLRSYRAARSEIGLSARHEQGLRSRVDDWRSGCRYRGVAVRRQLSHIAGASIRTVAPFPVAARQQGRGLTRRFRPKFVFPGGSLFRLRVSHHLGRATFPAPASSNAACGFPALRSPVCFASRIMGPILPERLSALVESLGRRRQSNSIRRRVARHARSQATIYAARARHSANAIERLCL
jgi:transposase-like protein